MISIFDHLHDHHPDAFRRCLTADDVTGAMADGVMAAILHIEGAEAIDEQLDNLEALYQRGLRSIGPVWSRSTFSAMVCRLIFPAHPISSPG